MAVPDKFRIYLEIVKGLNGCLTVGKKAMFLSVYSFPIFSIIHALEAYILAWGTVVWSPRLKLHPPTEPHLHTPRARALTGLRPVHVPNQVPFNIWCEPVLPFTLVRELDCEWTVVRISWYHSVSHL